MLVQDINYILLWWSVFFLIGIVNIPITYKIFKRFDDIGYGFAKIVGLTILSYFVFLGTSFHVVRFTRPVLFFAFSLLTTFNIFLFSKNKNRITNLLLKNKKIIFLEEFLFLGGLIFWSYVRGHQPDIRGLEKFMDFGFVNSILRSEFLPPADMWFSGSSINYYWFGHLITAIATKFSGIPSHITYNLMLGTILGLTLTGVFSLTITLLSNIKPKINSRFIRVAGIISAILLVFGGNFHTPYFVTKNGAQKYWYPDATRFIGYNPDVPDKTIHEFPMYSFVVADLHAHLINLPVVVLFLAVLWNLLYLVSKQKNYPKKNVAFLGFLLGIMFMTNTWDFGNYLMASSFTLGIFYLIKKGFNKNSFLSGIKIIIPAILVGVITAYPFMTNFDSLAKGVFFTHSKSALWQLAILWGFPAILSITFIIFIYKNFKKIQTPDVFILGLLATSWVLITIPEIIFVKDIYIDSHYRANTMFKLTYQAFVMFYLTSGYIFVRTISILKNKKLKLLLATYYLLLIYLILIYPSYAIKGYYGELGKYRELSGETWVKTYYPGEYKGILWFRQNVSGQPVILEANGDSYTDYNVVSAYTGLPTIEGWFVHEWLWRGSADYPAKRSSDVSLIYTAVDIEETKRVLKNYNVEYVIVGHFEREKYPNLIEEKFTQLGSLVFSSERTKIYKLN